MRQFICGVIATTAIGLMGAAALNLATEKQGTIGPALESLKFKYVAPSDGTVGGDMEYHVTRETLQYLRQHDKFILTGEGDLKPKK